jgi:hypothetical protein
MAKKPPSPIIGQIMDAGEWGAGGEITNPGSLVYVTADGERLTPDEAFRRAGASGPGGRKGMADASVATLSPLSSIKRRWASMSMPPTPKRLAKSPSTRANSAWKGPSCSSLKAGRCEVRLRRW